jgi:hypothetical protein
MKVYGELEVAQFEKFTDATKPAASSYPFRVIWISDLGQLYISNGTTWLAFTPASSSRLSSMYDIVIGSAAQVTAGQATHSTWATAIAAAVAGNSVFVLTGTWVENVTIDKQLNIVGCGYGSYINGTLTFSSAADHSIVTQLRVNGSVTLNTGADEIVCRNIFLPNGSTFVDNGTANYLEGIVA